jgi:hypothetical protein
VRTDKGKVIGVCGSGRIITDYIEAVKELETLQQDDIKCCLSIKKLVEVFKKYEFEEE